MTDYCPFCKVEVFDCVPRCWNCGHSLSVKIIGNCECGNPITNREWACSCGKETPLRIATKPKKLVK